MPGGGLAEGRRQRVARTNLPRRHGDTENSKGNTGLTTKDTKEHKGSAPIAVIARDRKNKTYHEAVRHGEQGRIGRS
jgi:hypothetical protein